MSTDPSFYIQQAMSDDDTEKIENEKQLELEWKDWIALTIAALSTFLFPFVALIVILISMSILFNILAS